MLDGQRHPLLQQESLVALTVLAATDANSSRHLHDIIRLLTDAQLSSLLPTPEDGSVSAPPPSFTSTLQRLMKQEGNTWAQTTLQAKSLVKQLHSNARHRAASNVDADGLAVLETELVPLLE
ncbi:hypothetical protein EC988_009811 [Linderina pennispora]|nr:hypothetical protein EC988_009811 [Linderina pennispora]